MVISGIELDGSRWAIEGVQKKVINSTASFSSNAWIYCLVGTLKDGRIIRTHIVCSEGSVVSSCRYLSYSVRFFMQEVAQSIRSSCFSLHVVESPSDSSPSQQLWFLGSANADSLLMRVESSAVTNLTLYGAGNSALGKRKVSTEIEMGPTPQNFQDAKSEEEFLYGSSLASGGGYSQSSISSHLQYQFSSISIGIDDSIPNIGPIVDGFFSANGDSLLNEISELDWDRSHTPSSFLLRKAEDSVVVSSMSERESKVSLQLCAGVEEQASLLRVYNGWPVSKVTSANFVGACGIFSIAAPPAASSVFSIFLLCSETATRVMYSAESEELGTASTLYLELEYIEFVIVFKTFTKCFFIRAESL